MGDDDMTEHIRPTLALLAAFTVLAGLAYPLVVTAVAQLAFPYQANGSLIVQNGRRLGSRLIGQQFDDPRYFWGRPSATPGGPYNAAAGGGRNWGPLNPALKAAVAQRIEALRRADPSSAGPVPVDLATASASGLDPHISPASAGYQVPRVARLRGLPATRVQALVAQCTEPRQWVFLGEPRVNVLRLNLALDALAGTSPRR
jgi:potassium-transporting ATPase KdpC subunit